MRDTIERIAGALLFFGVPVFCADRWGWLGFLAALVVIYGGAWVVYGEWRGRRRPSLLVYCLIAACLWTAYILTL